MTPRPSSERPLVVITRALPSAWTERLAPDHDVVMGCEQPGWDDAVLAALPRARGVLSLLTERVDATILERAPHLRVVSNMAVGVDNIDLPACAQRSIAVGHTPGVLTDATADLTMALLLSAARRIPEATRDAAEGRWTTWSPTGWLGRDLRGATLGIVGYGKIGRAVATRARAFGMRIVYTTRRGQAVPDSDGDARPRSLEALLSEADIVSLHVPLTPQTRHLIDAAALRAMKADALLVNTARGAVVDGDALVDALRTGVIGGAAIDVTDPEPLPPSHPMYRQPNLLVAPHIGSATTNTRRRMAELACDNLIAGVAGRALVHRIGTGH